MRIEICTSRENQAEINLALGKHATFGNRYWFSVLYSELDGGEKTTIRFVLQTKETIDSVPNFREALTRLFESLGINYMFLKTLEGKEEEVNQVVTDESEIPVVSVNVRLFANNDLIRGNPPPAEATSGLEIALRPSDGQYPHAVVRSAVVLSESEEVSVRHKIEGWLGVNFPIEFRESS